MKNLKDTLNESLSINEVNLRSKGPYKEAGDTTRMSVEVSNKIGLYTCLDRYLDQVDVIETKDIKTYLKSSGYKDDDIDEITGLKSGYSYSISDKYIWTCLSECY